MGSAGVAVRLAVLAAVVAAWTQMRTSDLRLAGSHVRQSEAPVGRAPGLGTWSMQFDGWRIEVDGVVGQPLDEDGDHASTVSASPYDHLMAKYAEAVGLDWRLVSAMVYEESRFQPDVEGPAGAYGLMQVRGLAAQDVGEDNYRAPEANIRAGVLYLKRLDEMFKRAQGVNRLALTLAAYNMGPAHVLDAQQLARRFGYDPHVWAGSMAVMVRLLEEPQIFEELLHGYAQGERVVAYVDRVLSRFAAYRRLLPVIPPAG